MTNSLSFRERRIAAVLSKCSYYSILIGILYIIMPIFRYVLPQGMRYLVIIGTLLFSFIGLIKNTFRVSVKELFVGFGILAFIFILFMGKWRYLGVSFIRYFPNIYLFWIGLLWINIIARADTKSMLQIKRFLVLSTFITTLTTIAGNQLFQEASRLASGTASLEESTIYGRLNIGAYGFVYGMVLMLPYLIFEIKHSLYKSHKIFYFVFLFAIFWLIFETQFTIAIVISIIILIMEVAYNSNKPIQTLAMILIGIAFYLLIKDSIIAFLHNLSDYFAKQNYEYLGNRFYLIADMLEGNKASGDALERWSRYKRSWDSFMNSPIAGGIFTRPNLGEHSEIMDLLGATGLCGTAIFVALLGSFWKKISKFRTENIYKHCVEATVAALVISLTNTIFTSPDIGMILFICPFLFRRKNSIKERVTA